MSWARFKKRNNGGREEEEEGSNVGVKCHHIAGLKLSVSFYLLIIAIHSSRSGSGASFCKCSRPPKCIHEHLHTRTFRRH